MHHHNQQPKAPRSGLDHLEAIHPAHVAGMLGEAAVLEARAAGLRAQAERQRNLQEVAHQVMRENYLEKTPDGKVVQGHLEMYEELGLNSGWAAPSTSAAAARRFREAMQGMTVDEMEEFAEGREHELNAWVEENDLGHLVDLGESKKNADPVAFYNGLKEAQDGLNYTVDELSYRPYLRLGNSVTVRRNGENGHGDYDEDGWTVDAIGATGKLTVTNGTLSKRVSVDTLKEWNPRNPKTPR